MRLIRLLLVASLLALTGCGAFRNGCTQMKSSLVMLDTHITLYACSGDTIATWHTRANVTTAGGEAWWVGDDGMQHHISGTFIVSGR